MPSVKTPQPGSINNHITSIDEVADLLWFYKPQSLGYHPLPPCDRPRPIIKPLSSCSACIKQQFVKRPRSLPIIHLSAIPCPHKKTNSSQIELINLEDLALSPKDPTNLSDEDEHEDNKGLTNCNQCYITLLSQVFITDDNKKDNKLSKDELRMFLDQVGLQSTYESILSLFKHISHSSIGNQEFVTSNDFPLLFEITSCCTSSTARQGQPNKNQTHHDIVRGLGHVEALLPEVFNIFDKDNDGFISPCDLQIVLCDMGFSKALKLDVCIEMIDRFDQDGDGQISFLEFKDMLEFVI